MDDTSKPPGEPFVFEEEKIEEVFGKTIQAKPEPPISFILYFKFNKTELSEESKKVIQKIPPAISARKIPSIGVIGHCDRSGSKEYNQRLALKRAEATRDFLVKTGIDTEAINVTSHGENNPLVETSDGVYEPRNRRVEVYVR
jgi:outer membrane protein OmpA-like peptidoglycan-associated protein